MNPFKKIFGVWLFIREIVANPGHVGAAVPSSKFLSKEMAAQIPDSFEGMIVELGAGTGVITRALLDRGIAPEKIVVIERSKSLCKHLNKRFRRLNIIHGDAADLNTLLNDYQLPVSAIVSGLPLRSLPRESVEKITAAVEKSLDNNGILIQFTYDLRKKDNELLLQFKRLRSKYVWCNIPPARVDVYQVK